MQSYKSKKLFEKVQHFGLLDCIHSEGIFSGVKNAAVSEMKRCVFFIVRCFGFSGGTAKGRQSAAGLPPCGGSGLKFSTSIFPGFPDVVSLHAEGVD